MFNPYSAPQRLAKLTIELTTSCNLKCAGCPRTTGISNGVWHDIHMDTGLFSRILQNIPPTNFVTLHGIGEPTLHPDFNTLVGMAKSSGKFQRIKMTTNALARSIDYYVESVNAGLDEFWVSVDTFDQSIADKMRFGTKVEKLERRVSSLLARNLPVHISMVVSSKNYFDIPNTLAKLHSMGRPPVHMQEFQDFGDDYGLLSADQRREFLCSLQKASKNLPGMLIVPPNYALPSGEICSAPWFRPAISVQGYMTPCCTTFDPTLWGHLNIGEWAFEKIWQHPSLLNWISDFLANKTPICAGCGLNPRRGGVEDTLGRSGKTGKESHVLNELSSNRGGG